MWGMQESHPGNVYIWSFIHKYIEISHFNIPRNVSAVTCMLTILSVLPFPYKYDIGNCVPHKMFTNLDQYHQTLNPKWSTYLSWDGSLALNVSASDIMARFDVWISSFCLLLSLSDHLIYGCKCLESDEAKPTWLLRHLVSDDDCICDFSILAEVLPQVLFCCFKVEAAEKELADLFWFVLIIKNK